MPRFGKFGMVRIAIAMLATSGAFAFHSQPTFAQLSDPMQSVGVRPDLLKEVGIDQKLGQQVLLDLTFRDETGKTVQLGQYFGQRPVILSLVYFNCPMLCTQVLNGQEAVMKGLPMEAGNQFEAVTVSIDPSDKPVRLRSGLETIRARQRDHGADSGRKTFEVFLRNPVFAEGFAAGPGGSIRSKNRNPGGFDFAVLLSLRSPYREIRTANFAADPGGWCADDIRDRYRDARSFPARAVFVAGL